MPYLQWKRLAKLLISKKYLIVGFIVVLALSYYHLNYIQPKIDRYEKDPSYRYEDLPGECQVEISTLVFKVEEGEEAIIHLSIPPGVRYYNLSTGTFSSPKRILIVRNNITLNKQLSAIYAPLKIYNIAYVRLLTRNCSLGVKMPGKILMTENTVFPFRYLKQ